MDEKQKQPETEEQQELIEETQEETKENELSLGDRFCRSVLDWTETIVVAIALVTLVFTFFGRIITVDGSSMVPTYHDGDRVLVTELAGEAKQGDIVIIVNTLDKPIIKRIVATGGQTVDFDADLGEVTIDGVPLKGEVFGIENGITMLPQYANVMQFPQTVPEGSVFVLGDNRGNSTDSRFIDVGMVDRRNILGKVVLNLYPFSKIGIVK